MDNLLYEMITKRKSFHLFNLINSEKITTQELAEIEKKFKELQPLENDIKIDMQILSSGQTTCKRGQEYCILLYSEEKKNYLPNIGYVGEQLDLYLASMNIGALWYGIGKVENKVYQDLQFVIMIAIKKVPKEQFRKDMFKSKRKPIEEIWTGEVIKDVATFVRFAPSACNTQPWLVENHDSSLSVFRYKKAGKRGIMPANQVAYYNSIDIGIFLLFLELCLQHEKISFIRKNHVVEGDGEKTLVATYQLTED